MTYVKTVEQHDTGMVVAAVYQLPEGRRVGLEFFHRPWHSQKKRLQLAHAWCDSWIKNCEDYCVGCPDGYSFMSEAEAKGSA